MQRKLSSRVTKPANGKKVPNKKINLSVIRLKKIRKRSLELGIVALRNIENGKNIQSSYKR